jgi:hypothetical protein
VKKILILLASVPMLAIPAPAMAQSGPPLPHVCPNQGGFVLVETTGLVDSGSLTRSAKLCG